MVELVESELKCARTFVPSVALVDSSTRPKTVKPPF